MYTRHNEVPVFEARTAVVSAARFNQYCLARKRVGDPIRLPLPGLRSLQLILQADAWIIVDSALHDLPVAAWSDFAAQERDNLHQPIQCRLRLYHAHAGLLLERVLKSMEAQLRDELARHSHPPD